LIEKFKKGVHEYVMGYSRWYDLDGHSIWKKCRIIAYNDQN